MRSPHQGQKQGKKLAAKRTKALVAATNFNETEIGALNVYFQEIGDKKKNEVVIDRDQFKSALGLKESLFINRMFLMFDTGKLRISTTMTGNNFGPFFFVYPSPFSPT